MRDDAPKPGRKRTQAEYDALDRAFAGDLRHAPNLTELTGCEDDDMNQEDREALKRHDLLIDENRDRVTALMSEYRADQKWLRASMEEHGKKIDRIAERLDSVDRTVNNGIKERQIELVKRVANIETALDQVVTKDELTVHKEDEEKRHTERWQGQHRRKEDKYKTLAMAVSIVGTLLTLGSVIALYLSLVL